MISSDVENTLNRRPSNLERAVENIEKRAEKTPAIIDTVLLYLDLAFTGIAGVLIRMGLEKLTTFSGSQYGGLLWANFAGCLLMGYLVHDKVWTGQLMDAANRYRRKHRVYDTKANIPLYVTFSTGICGSITSFSSLMTELFYFSSNTKTLGTGHVNYPNTGYGVMVFLSYLIITMSVSFSAFYMGKNFAYFTDYLLGQKNIQILSKFEFIIELFLAFLGLAGWIVVLVLTITESSWRSWTFPCIFAPLGVYSRLWLSQYMNGWSNKFKWGTFSANMIGTLLVNVLSLLERARKPSTQVSLISSSLQCTVLIALENGYCGNLSTISTFISELASMKTHHAYSYGFWSLFIGFSITILIMGSYAWANGLVGTCGIGE